MWEQVLHCAGRRAKLLRATREKRRGLEVDRQIGGIGGVFLQEQWVKEWRADGGRGVELEGEIVRRESERWGPRCWGRDGLSECR